LQDVPACADLPTALAGQAGTQTGTSWLKGSEIRWDIRNADAMMALAALEHSGPWKTYWGFQCRLAA
jgi:hypothetical protein